MLHEGEVVTATVLLQILLHPSAVVTVTEYLPPALTVMHLVVAPLLHKYVEEADGGAQSSMDSPMQSEPFPVRVQLKAPTTTIM